MTKEKHVFVCKQYYANRIVIMPLTKYYQLVLMNNRFFVLLFDFYLFCTIYFQKISTIIRYNIVNKFSTSIVAHSSFIPCVETHVRANIHTHTYVYAQYISLYYIYT